MKVSYGKYAKWWLIDFKQFPFLIGTYKTFGFRAALTLMSPVLNTILNWKHRHKNLKGLE